MPDITIKLSDGIREITVEISGSDDDPLTRAEDTAIRVYRLAISTSPQAHRAGFGDWSLGSDTERSLQEEDE